MRRLSLAAALVLFACKPGGNADPPSTVGEVVVMSASYSETSHAPEPVISKCKFEREIASAIIDYADGAVPQGGKAPKLLTLEVQRMNGVEEDWEGDRSVILVGELSKDGDVVGSFTIKRAAPGGVMPGMSSICKGLDDVADYMGEDIARWLKNPKKRSKL